MDKQLYDRGLTKRRQVLGDAYVDHALANVDDFNRDFQRLATEYCWGEAWGDDTLSPRERSILTLGMVSPIGTTTETTVPRPGSLEISRVPPARWARSRIPGMPQ